MCDSVSSNTRYWFLGNSMWSIWSRPLRA